MSFGYDRWPRYVSVAERRRKAEKEMGKLVKKGGSVQPVVLEGRKIAKTFWGKAWCDNLEGYSDFESRLPRGRTYVRNGSVCHLEISRGIIHARVCGTSLYTVTIGIQPLSAEAWAELRKRCAGKISSLLELLSGKLADGVMEIVTDRTGGLFPKPSEITMECSCPDWATMCKHVAAVLYGVGARLDEKPELLFLLRGVDHLDLVTASLEDAVSSTIQGGSGRRLAEGDLSEVFGVDFDDEPPSEPAATVPPSPARSSKAAVLQPGIAKPGTQKPRVQAPQPEKPVAPVRTSKGKVPEPKGLEPFPEQITGDQVRMLRESLGLTVQAFAQRLSVSGASITKWEKNTGILNLQDRSRAAFEAVWVADEKPKRKRSGRG